MKSSAWASVSPHRFVGDHPAMDLLNTIVRVESGLVDLWESDKDVLRWLLRAGLLESKVKVPAQGGAILLAGQRLREISRGLVVARKSDMRLNLSALNDFLAKGESHCQLTRAKDGALSMTRRYQQTNPEGMLAPLAETVAQFLATADFSLVRRCEGEGCVLWFSDRTRAHRRRWCSMEVCGNRSKVTRFRARRRT